MSHSHKVGKQQGTYAFAQEIVLDEVDPGKSVLAEKGQLFQAWMNL
jgi:hypothetical protein